MQKSQNFKHFKLLALFRQHAWVEGCTKRSELHLLDKVQKLSFCDVVTVGNLLNSWWALHSNYLSATHCRLKAFGWAVHRFFGSFQSHFYGSGNSASKWSLFCKCRWMFCEVFSLSHPKLRHHADPVAINTFAIVLIISYAISELLRTSRRACVVA